MSHRREKNAHLYSAWRNELPTRHSSPFGSKQSTNNNANSSLFSFFTTPEGFPCAQQLCTVRWTHILKAPRLLAQIRQKNDLFLLQQALVPSVHHSLVLQFVTKHCQILQQLLSRSTTRYYTQNVSNDVLVSFWNRDALTHQHQFFPCRNDTIHWAPLGEVVSSVLASLHHHNTRYMLPMLTLDHSRSTSSNYF